MFHAGGCNSSDKRKNSIITIKAKTIGPLQCARHKYLKSVISVTSQMNIMLSLWFPLDFVEKENDKTKE